MRSERILQAGVIALATVAGHAAGERADSAPEPSTPSSAAPGVDDTSVAAPAARTARGAGPRQRWRRTRGATDSAFDPVLVVAGDLPPPDRPDDTERDPEWAEPMERAMGTDVNDGLAELFPDARPSVRCMSWSCRVDIEVPPDQAHEVHAFVQRTMPLGPRAQDIWDSSDPAAVRIGFDVDLRDVHSLDEWREWRAMVNEAGRAQFDAVITAKREGRPWLDER